MLQKTVLNVELLHWTSPIYLFIINELHICETFVPIWQLIQKFQLHVTPIRVFLSVCNFCLYDLFKELKLYILEPKLEDKSL